MSLSGMAFCVFALRSRTLDGVFQLDSPTPFWVDDVTLAINKVLLVIVVGVEIWALVHCVLQRADAFTAAGKLSKGAWLGINVLAIFFTLVFGSLGIFGLIAIIAALVYLLDVRPAVREITEGGGSAW
jgi:hypothetical protein